MVIDCFDDPPSSCVGGVVSIGNFDGVHWGHSRLLAVLRANARLRGIPAVVVSFDPHPVAILRPSRAAPALTPPARKRELLLAGGADDVLIFRTSHRLLDLSAEHFFERILIERLQVRGLVEGPNFMFGKDRRGDVALLANLCRRHEVHLDVVEIVADGGATISSTRIRECLAAGDVATARMLLGRPHTVGGTVVEAERRGRQLGFPTANLHDLDAVIPADGVYAVRAGLPDGRGFAGACNIGPNPTFADDRRKFEVHLLDFDEDLYGQSLQVGLLDRLRAIEAFPNADALRVQLDRDTARARTVYRLHAEPQDARLPELSRTITEWLRHDVGRALAVGDGRNFQARLHADGTLMIDWPIITEQLPSSLMDVLTHLDDRIRKIFPEVHQIESSSPASCLQPEK